MTELPITFSKPAWHHRVCARPMVICWVLGTLLLWILTTVMLRAGGIFPGAFSYVWILIFLLYLCLAKAGFYVGALGFGLPVTWICRRVNGAPFAVGDHVIILTGPYAGTTTTVLEITGGQGGRLLPRLDLGEEVRKTYGDVFFDYALLRANGKVA